MMVDFLSGIEDPAYEEGAPDDREDNGDQEGDAYFGEDTIPVYAVG